MNRNAAADTGQSQVKVRDWDFPVYGAQPAILCGEGPEGGGGGSYSHFPAQILTKSHCPRAQIPSSQWLFCSNLNPIPIFYCFFADESQSQCMKSHFPTQK